MGSCIQLVYIPGRLGLSFSLRCGPLGKSHSFPEYVYRRAMGAACDATYASFGLSPARTSVRQSNVCFFEFSAGLILQACAWQAFTAYNEMLLKLGTLPVALQLSGPGFDLIFELQ